MKRPHAKEFARAKTDRLIRERFTSSSMSNAKWIRLLRCMAERAGTTQCHAKLVWDEEKRDLWIDEDLIEGIDYYHNSMEAMVSGFPRGFYDYKEIHWLEFPRDCQSVDEIRDLIDAVGQFDLEDFPDHLRLWCYRI